MIQANNFNSHNEYTGISAQDELFIAEKIFRLTGIPMAKNKHATSIDLFSLDPDRKLYVEVEGTHPHCWGQSDSRPQKWKYATFVFKKMQYFIECRKRAIPSAYIKVNHYMDAIYAVSGESLLDRLAEPGGVWQNDNGMSDFNQSRFVRFDWEDTRLLLGLDGIRDFFWDLMMVSGQRKIKSRARKEYMDRDEASDFYRGLEKEEISIDVHETMPLGFLQSYYWLNADIVNVVI